jgi:hypothetical protein
MDAVTRLGTSDWNRVAAEVPGFSGRQCRERWKNYLSPNLTEGPWTSEEDQMLVDAFHKLGSKWSVITKSFPNRSRNSIKNRYSRLERAKRKSQQSSELDLLTDGKRDSTPSSSLLDFLDAHTKDDDIIWIPDSNFDDGSFPL